MACFEIKNIESRELYFRILRNALKYNFPVHAYIELTSECNAKCFLVFRENGIGRREVFLLWNGKIYLFNLRNADAFGLYFQGGEPLIREDFWELVDFVRKNRFVVSLVTNGIVLN